MGKNLGFIFSSASVDTVEAFQPNEIDQAIVEQIVAGIDAANSAIGDQRCGYPTVVEIEDSKGKRLVSVIKKRI